MNQYIYRHLASLPFKDINPESLTSVADCFPVNTKVLWRSFAKDVLKQEGVLLTVITGHLYVDYILGLFLKREGEDASSRKYQSFSGKLKKVNSLGYLEVDEYKFLSEINKLRNKLAHDVFFDVSTWDISLLPPISQYGMRIPKNRKTRVHLVEILSKCCFFEVYNNLTDRNAWLSLVDIPKN